VFGSLYRYGDFLGLTPDKSRPLSPLP